MHLEFDRSELLGGGAEPLQQRVPARIAMQFRERRVAGDPGGGAMACLEAQCGRIHAFYVGNATPVAPQSPPTQGGAE